ncbi:MAG: enoyl-CoA hydratase-related protein, partial [Hydrogenophaga sp.]|uniref:enoyl-CoA hydratase-related protein n=1 Tax=Hydrogenophaga sp. TaxID=1904254 RepID=UPI003D9B1AE1
MSEDILLHSRDERGVHTITLNQPKAFNALSEAMMAAFGQALDAVAADPAARVLVIAANGKAFCAGHDLKEMKSKPDQA